MKRSRWIVGLVAGAIAATPLAVAAAHNPQRTTATDVTCSAPPSSEAPLSSEPPVETTTPVTSTSPAVTQPEDGADDSEVDAGTTTVVADVSVATEVDSEVAAPTSEPAVVTDVSVTEDTSSPDVQNVSQASAVGLRSADRIAPARLDPVLPDVAPPPRPVQVIRFKVVSTTNTKGITFYELFDAEGKRDECNALRISFHRSDLRGTNRNIRIGNVKNMRCTLVSLTIGGRPDATAVLVDEPIQPAEGPRYFVPSIHYTGNSGRFIESVLIEVEVHCTEPVR